MISVSSSFVILEKRIDQNPRPAPKQSAERSREVDAFWKEYNREPSWLELKVKALRQAVLNVLPSPSLWWHYRLLSAHRHHVYTSPVWASSHESPFYDPYYDVLRVNTLSAAWYVLTHKARF